MMCKTEDNTFMLAGGTLLWSVVAFIAGAVFGFGAFLANQKNSKIKYFGMNLLPAVFTAEGLDNVIHIKDYSHMIPAVVMKIIILMFFAAAFMAGGYGIMCSVCQSKAILLAGKERRGLANSTYYNTVRHICILAESI